MPIMTARRARTSRKPTDPNRTSVAVAFTVAGIAVLWAGRSLLWLLEQRW
jgi:hypothetical protein